MDIIGEFSRLSNLKVLFEYTFPNLYEYLYLHPYYYFIDPFNDYNIRKMIKEEALPELRCVQIETINKCNGTCRFCPGNIIDDTRKKIIMSDKLFTSIITQLKDMNYSGKVVMQCNNEPLLDSKILDRVAFARKNLPNAYLLMYTNGTLLNYDRINSLITNLDMLYLDNYYIASSDDRVNPATKMAYEYIKEHPEYSNRLTVIFNRVDAKRGSRAGLATNRKFVHLRSICDYPFTDMNIMPDGKLTMCCNDSMAFTEIGDLNVEKIKDAFNNFNYNSIRKDMLRGGRREIKRCLNCDALNHPPKIIPKLMSYLGGN